MPAVQEVLLHSTTIQFPFKKYNKRKMAWLTATKFNLAFGAYVMALGLTGMSKPALIPWVIDTINSAALPQLELSPFPTKGYDSEFPVVFFMLVFVIGLIYVVNSIIAIIMSDTKQMYAMASVVARIFLSVTILKLVYMDHRISSGFVIFVFQDTITAAVTVYQIMTEKDHGKEKIG